jgi:F0F1-type ATP synthase assembly protein I
MTTIPHEQPSSSVSRSVRFEGRDVLVTVAIVVIWLAVLFVGVFGPDFVGHSNDGNSATIPSGIFVAFFALFATISVAKYGFSKRTSDN